MWINILHNYEIQKFCKYTGPNLTNQEQNLTNLIFLMQKSYIYGKSKCTSFLFLKIYQIWFITNFHCQLKVWPRQTGGALRIQSTKLVSLSIVSMVAVQTTFSFSTKNPSKQSSANFNKCNFSRFTDYLFWVLNSYYHISSLPDFKDKLIMRQIFV